MWDDELNELMVCSRNNQLGENETNKFWQAVNKYNLKNMLKVNPDIVIQAECYGEGIQKNKLGIKGVDLAIFNVSRKSNRTRFGYHEMSEFCVNFGLPMVHVCCEINSFDWNFDKLQAYADIQRYSNGELAEGIVVRPFEPFMSQHLYDMWSVKIISREYKL
jgi:ATP-dependent RNA circularization protein (DNA/RNA ligase family)